MRLLNTSTFSLEMFEGSNFPKYAILSHTWSSDELTYQDMVGLTADVRRKPGFIKAQRFCDLARSLNFVYVWMDTCCIDKQSSAELTEAINSMFRWYQQAEICFVHLQDLDATTWSAIGGIVAEQIKLLRPCRWFTRGWTLQEYIASQVRRFVTNDWQSIVMSEAEVCSSITGIDRDVLSQKRPLTQVCIAERMSWAAERETTRPEDRAYSLMGLFQVNMPVLYGEGMQKAFRRLQEDVMRRSFDPSLFAWHAAYESSGLLAHSPLDFRGVPPVSLSTRHGIAPHHMTNAGIVIRPYRVNVVATGNNIHNISVMLQCDLKPQDEWASLVIHLERIADVWCWVNGQKCEAYRRIECSDMRLYYGPIPLHVRPEKFQQIVVLEDEHFELVQQSIEDQSKR